MTQKFGLHNDILHQNTLLQIIFLDPLDCFVFGVYIEKFKIISISYQKNLKFCYLLTMCDSFIQI